MRANIHSALAIGRVSTWIDWACYPSPTPFTIPCVYLVGRYLSYLSQFVIPPLFVYCNHHNSRDSIHRVHRKPNQPCYRNRYRIQVSKYSLHFYRHFPPGYFHTPRTVKYTYATRIAGVFLSSIALYRLTENNNLFSTAIIR